jgi:hypothetical protein
LVWPACHCCSRKSPEAEFDEFRAEHVTGAERVRERSDRVTVSGARHADIDFAEHQDVGAESAEHSADASKYFSRSAFQKAIRAGWRVAAAHAARASRPRAAR